MPKVGMEPLRRRQLIEATIASIAAHGYADATTQRISREAGVSTGILHHYFDGKADLLESTMRWLMADLRRQVVRRLRTARGPRERLGAIIDGNFVPEQFDARTAAAWLAFWAHAPQTLALRRLERINARRLQSNLRHALCAVMPRERAARVALGLAALIDGLSVRCALGTAGLTREEARRIARDHLRAELALPVQAKG